MDSRTSSPISDLEAPEKQGSRVLGITGALAGALIGAIPWFLVSAFASFFVGWLGFLVGYAACLGYRKLGGYRSTGFATVVVIFSSIAALLISDFASNMLMLCTDSSWQRSAARYGISVFQLAFDSLMMPENWGLILPNLIIGMLIGMLGVFSARSQILHYTDPEKAAKIAAAYPRPLGAQPVSTGLALPQQFTVASPKIAKAAAWIVIVLCGIIILLPVILSLIFGGPEDFSVFSVIGISSLFLAALGVWLVITTRNRRLEVDGEQLCFYSATGKPTHFQAQDIANVSISMFNGACTLYGHDNKVLAKLLGNMKNIMLLKQYLAEHNIGLRA